MFSFRRVVQLLVGAGLFVACSTGPKQAFIAPYSPDHPIGEKLAFLPPKIEIEINGETEAGDAGDRARTEIRGSLEAALAREHLDGRYVFASDTDGAEAAMEAASWVRSTEICAGGYDVVESRLPRIRELTQTLGAGAAVFVDARLHLASKGRRAGQIAAGTLIAAASVAIVALAVYVVLEGESPSGCASATAEVAVDVSDVVAQSAIAQMERASAAQQCAQKLPLPQEDEHGFWTGNHLDLGVAVISAAGELLWYRAGKLPLKKDDDNAAKRLAAFFAGMP